MRGTCFCCGVMLWVLSVPAFGQRVYMAPVSPPTADIMQGDSITIYVQLDGSTTPFIDLSSYDIGLEVTALGGNTGSFTATAYELDTDNPNFVFAGEPVLSNAQLATLQGGALKLSGTQIDITTSDAYLVEITLASSGDATGQWRIGYKQVQAQNILQSGGVFNIDIVDDPGNFEDLVVTVLPQPVGRCCFDPFPNCSEVTEFDCIALGGIWDEGLNCGEDCPGGLTPLATRCVASGLSSPVYLTAPPNDFDRVFIVEQTGEILILTDGGILPTPFLDLSSQISIAFELGLLSMAFHPDYETNGFFYVYYSNLDQDTVVARFTVSGDPEVADPASEVILKTIPQPSITNNGGQLQFDADGFLYVGMGDGGSVDNPGETSQDPSTLLGKMLRLDVDNPPEYIPSSNPYVGSGDPLDEIWATGVRNPWRFSFDRLTGDLYLADVGEADFEEVNIQPASGIGGQNYGWPIMEGFACFDPPVGCDQTGLTLPVLVLSHADDGACAIIGGYVYRGTDIPGLPGTYFFTDFCSQQFTTFRYVGGTVTDLQNRTEDLEPVTGGLELVSSFGEDAAGELYILDLIGGDVCKIIWDPLVSAERAGARYIAVTPNAGTTPFRILVTSLCTGESRYVGQPGGPPFDVALLVDDPGDAAFLTPDDWGEVVYVTGLHLAPDVTYAVQAENGLARSQALTASTSDWADVNADGFVTFTIDLAIVFSFIIGPPEPGFTIYQVDFTGPGNVPDTLVTFTADLQATFDALIGLPYLGPGTCGACCLTDGGCVDDLTQDDCQLQPLFANWSQFEACAEVICP